MDFELTDDQRMIRDMVRDFAQKEIAPIAAEMDKTEEFPWPVVRKMGGWACWACPSRRSTAARGPTPSATPSPWRR